MLQQVSGGKERNITDKLAVVSVCGETSASWKVVENYGKRTRCTRNVEHFCQERARIERFREDTEEERHAGIQRQWQLDSPAREYLEQMKCCNDLDGTRRMI